MSLNPNYLQLAEDLLSKAAEFDHADHDQAVDDDDFTRTEVLKDFVERWVEKQLSAEVATSLNRLTKHPGHIDGDELAPRLERLLSASLK